MDGLTAAAGPWNEIVDFLCPKILYHTYFETNKQRGNNDNNTIDLSNKDKMAIFYLQ